jgi:hypothetical protein
MLVVGNVIIGMRDREGEEGAKVDGRAEGRGEEGIGLMATVGGEGAGDGEEGGGKGGGEGKEARGGEALREGE